MSLNVTQGNAKSDGRDFSFWFIGAIEEWCLARGMLFDHIQSLSGSHFDPGVVNVFLKAIDTFNEPLMVHS